MQAWRTSSGVGKARYALLVGAATFAFISSPAFSQEAEQPSDTTEEQADQPADEQDALPVPPPPADASLPEVERVISDEEFAERVPDLDVDDDAELDRELETIEDFERRLAAEESAEDGEEVLASEAPLNEPALADGDTSEEIGDAPIRDAELVAPLPPIDSFEVEPVEFAEAESGEEVVEIAYKVELNGIDEIDEATDANIRDMFNDLSALRDGDGDAANVAQVSARLEEDSRLIERILAAEGWYGATVEARIDRSEEANGQPLTAVLDVAPGPRYSFAEINIEAGPTEPPNLIRDNFPLEVGEPIIATRVQAAEALIAVTLPQEGYPFVDVGQRDILLDPETEDGVYTLPVETGPRSRFGGIVTTGDLAFDAEHVALLARFERGELYDSRLVDDLRQALIATGLFNTVTVEPERTGEDAGEGTEFVTMLVEQQAGPPRTLAASAGYGTGQGPRVSGSWSHRNLFPPEGAVIASATLGTREQGLSGTFRRSNAGRRDRSFEAVAEALHTDYDAFEAFTGRLSARVSYDSTPIWQKRITYAYGAQLIGTVEDDYFPEFQERQNRTFFIGGLTSQFGIDFTESLLDPTKGFRVTALVEPEGSLQDGFTPYVRARVDASGYYPVGDSIVLAGRVRLGTIQGIDRFDLAPSRRFYAGGGGSVRGFSFQALGPQTVEPNPNFDPDDPDEEDDPFISRPIGGRSLNEAAAEVRYRFGNFGVVGFVDVGQVYESEFPEFDDLRFGAGIGGRYYTNFGPLRIDIATPIDRQEGESLINVYVSIGQAF